MRVVLFFDQRFTAQERLTGVGHHIVNMCHGLRNSTFDLSILSTSDQTPSSKYFADYPVEYLPIKWRTADIMWKVTNRAVSHPLIESADVVYCPKNDYIPVMGKRLLITIHGAHELDPNFGNDWRTQYSLAWVKSIVNYSRIISRADTILTVSEWLKEFIVRRFSCDRSRIEVIGNGVSNCFFDAFGKAAITVDQQRWITCVGGLNYIDGGDYVINLAEFIEQRRLPYRIMIAGANHEPHLLAKAARLKVITLLGHLEHSELAELFSRSCALYYPTRYETFGMAAAESMASGCPVVSSGLEAMKEVLGKAGVYIVPERTSHVFEEIERLADDVVYRDSIRLRAREAATEFTWSNCVDRLCNVLNDNSS